MVTTFLILFIFSLAIAGMSKSIENMERRDHYREVDARRKAENEDNYLNI